VSLPTGFRLQWESKHKACSAAGELSVILFSNTTMGICLHYFKFHHAKTKRLKKLCTNAKWFPAFATLASCTSIRTRLRQQGSGKSRKACFYDHVLQSADEHHKTFKMCQLLHLYQRKSHCDNSSQAFFQFE